MFIPLLNGTNEAIGSLVEERLVGGKMGSMLDNGELLSVPVSGLVIMGMEAASLSICKDFAWDVRPF